MRLNKFISQSSNLSRRKADEAIVAGRVKVNEAVATLGQSVEATDIVMLDGRVLTIDRPTTTIMINKPRGYVCSRLGQGSKSVYDIVPNEYHHLNLVGRLDKDSSGLLLLTNDGELANKLTHPKYGKKKVYKIELGSALKQNDQNSIEQGVELEDGLSKLELSQAGPSRKNWQVTMHEGRKRQIRRTFKHLGYQVTVLHRIRFGNYELGDLEIGSYRVLA